MSKNDIKNVGKNTEIILEYIQEIYIHMSVLSGFIIRDLNFLHVHSINHTKSCQAVLSKLNANRPLGDGKKSLRVYG